MLQNYFKIAWRNLVKDRLFTFLNVLGLSMGLACVLLIFLWVNDELSVDQFHENKNRLYHVMRMSVDNGLQGIDTYESNSDLLVPALAAEMPEIDQIVSTSDGLRSGIISNKEQSVKAQCKFVDPNYFDVFSFILTQGNKKKVLKDKYSLAISDELAIKLFGTTKNIVNKTLKWDEGIYTGTYTITGVFRKPDSHSSEKFDFLLTTQVFIENNSMDKHWDSNRVIVYVTLKDGVDVNKFSAKIEDFVRNKFKAQYGEKNLHWIGKLFLQPYSERYLHNVYENGAPAGGRIDYVNLFSVIALFILVIACINFMNLSTAKAARRMKEVGIRKVIGVSRRALILQYISESTLISFISLFIALLIVLLALPTFNNITSKQIALQLNPSIIIGFIAIGLFTGILAGSYPAFYLSGLKPISILKGKLQTSLGELWTRKGLVVFQFTVSAVFIISVMVIYNQMAFIHQKNLGLNKDNIIKFSNEGNISKKQKAFLNEVKGLGGVLNATGMSGNLIGSHSGGGGIDWEGKTERVEFSGFYVEYDFLETLGLKVENGRSFSPEFGADSTKVIFNETAIKAMNIKNPVGKMVSMWGVEKQIVGVVRDFHFESLYNKVGPFFLTYTPHTQNVLIKIKAGTEQETLAQIGKIYQSYNTGLPFEFEFLDQDYQTLYASEQRIATLSKYFAALAILISCLGLFGLAAFSAQRRQKEIGIRKVVGATASNIVVLLSTDFLQLVLIGMLVAFPIAWWAMEKWLKNFAYHTDNNLNTYWLTGLAIIIITLLTVSYQAIKAALMNPVKSLKTE